MLDTVRSSNDEDILAFYVSFSREVNSGRGGLVNIFDKVGACGRGFSNMGTISHEVETESGLVR